MEVGFLSFDFFSMLSQNVFASPLILGGFLLLFFVLLSWKARIPPVGQALIIGPLIGGLAAYAYLPGFFWVIPWFVVSGLWIYVFWHLFYARN